MSYLDRIQEIQSQIDEGGNTAYENAERGVEFLKSHSSGKFQSIIDTLNKGGQVAIASGLAVKGFQESVGIASEEAKKQVLGKVNEFKGKVEDATSDLKQLGGEVRETFQNEIGIAQSAPLTTEESAEFFPNTTQTFDFSALGKELEDPNALEELGIKAQVPADPTLANNPYANAMVGGGKPAGTGGAEGLESGAVETTTQQAQSVPSIRVEDTDYTDPFGNTVNKINYQSPENQREYQQLFGDDDFQVRGQIREGARQQIDIERFQQRQSQIERPDPFGGEFSEGGAVGEVKVAREGGRVAITRGEDTNPFSTPLTQERDIGLRGQVARNQIGNVDTTPLQSHELLDQTQTPLTSQGELRPTIAEPYEPPFPEQSARATDRIPLEETTQPATEEPTISGISQVDSSASGLMESATGETSAMGFGETLGKALGIGGDGSFGLAGGLEGVAGTEGMGLAIDAGTIGALGEGAGAGLLVGALALDLLKGKMPDPDALGGLEVPRVGGTGSVGFDPEAIKVDTSSASGTIV